MDDVEEVSHVDSGVLGILAFPWAYRTLKRLLRKSSNQKRLITQFIRPVPGCRILDIGCGPADIVAYLPDDIGAYIGLDFNPRYIEYATQCWAGRTNCRFECRNVNDLEADSTGTFDIVLALGLLHHLADTDARQLFRTIAALLKPGARLITYDGVYVEKQNPVARWLIARDRGRAVRTEAGYLALAGEMFPDTTGVVLHDTLRLPYTIFLMTCVKPR